MNRNTRPIRSTGPGRALSLALALGLAPSLALAGGGYGGERAKPDQAQATGDLVETAVAAGQFKTLAAALEAAGLVDTLKGGEFTVFAPTDDAFAALPEGTVESLLEPENKDRLVAVLTYHVVPGRYPASRVAGMDSATTVNGAAVDIRSGDGKIMVEGATVVKADVGASNGVIHVIDKVLLPGG